MSAVRAHGGPRSRSASVIVVIGLIVALVAQSSARSEAAGSRSSARVSKARKAEAVADARRNTTISGPSGGQVELDIPRTVLFNNAGFDSTVSASKGRYVGVLIAKTGNGYRHLSRDWYLHYKPTEEALCPGEQCPLPRYMDMAASGEQHELGGGAYRLKLRPGRYTAILLGEPGARVTATLRLKGLSDGKLSIATTGKAGLNTKVVDPIGAEDGHDVLSRAYFQDDVGGPRFDALILGFGLSLPAAAGSSYCFTYSDQPGFAETSAICAGGGGGAIPQPILEIGGKGYGLTYSFGFTTEGYFSHGYDANAVATESRIAAIALSIEFPGGRSTNGASDPGHEIAVRPAR